MTRMNDITEFVFSEEEVSQHRHVIDTLNIIHFTMKTVTNQGQFKQFKSRLNKANRDGDMSPVVQEIVRFVTGYEVDADIAEIYANAVRDKINERGVRYVDYSDAKERKLIQQGYKCANRFCQTYLTADEAEVGHIIPKKLVGNTLGEDNIQAVCKNCNRGNHTNYNVREFMLNRKINRV